MNIMRFITLILSALCLASCSDIQLATGGGISAPNAPASYANRLKLRGMHDLAGVTAVFPDGSGLTIQEVKTSPHLAAIGQTVTTLGMQKLVLGPAVKGWFGNKATEFKEAGATNRAKIAADKEVEIQRLKPVEPVTPVTP